MDTTKKSAKPLYKRRWLQVIASVAVLFVLLIILLPVGIRYALQEFLLQQGAQSAQIEDVDFNLFTGELQVSNLRVKRKDESTLLIPKVIANADWTPLLKKRAVIPSILLQGLDIWIDRDANGKLQIGGIPLPRARVSAASEQGKVQAWGYSFSDVTIGDSTLHLRLPIQTADIHINRLSLTKVKSWVKDDQAILDLAGEYNKAQVSLQAKLNLFADQPLITGTLHVKAFELANLSAITSTYLSGIGGRVALDSEFRVLHVPRKHYNIEADLGIQADNLALQSNEEKIQQDKINWKGKITAQLDHQFKTASLDIDGSIASENLQVSIQQPAPIQYSHASLNWDGKLHLDLADIARLQLNANMRGKQILVTGNDQQVLFRGGELQLTGLTALGTQDIQAQSLQLKDLAVLDQITQGGKSLPALARSAQLDITKIKITSLNLAEIGNIQAQDFLAYAHRNPGGKLVHLSALPQIQSTEKDAKTSKPGPFEIKIGSIDVTGKSHARFVDEAVTPAYDADLAISTLQVSAVDSTRPGEGSPFKLLAKIGEYSKVDLKGKLYPFASPLSLQVNGNVDNISLPPLSSYTAHTLGYNLKSGQLNAKLDVKIQKGEIQAENDLRLSNLTVTPADPEKIKSLTAQLSMPLDSALSMLRDKNNDIKLKLPVTGNIRDPDFNISDAINTALGKVMRSAAMTYLTTMLQPYGALYTLGKMISKASSAVQLDPVEFPAGSAEPDPGKLPYLKKLGDVLSGRPQLRLKLCGIASNTDRELLIQKRIQELRAQLKAAGKPDADKELAKQSQTISIPDDELLALAKQRAESIKQKLVNEYQIGADRLFICNPEIDTSEKGKPRVDIGI